MPLQVQRDQIQQDQLQEEDEEEVGEIYGGRMQRIYKKVHEMTIRFASTRIGQFVFERGDRVLRVIEDTAKWSLPRDDTDIKLERPLPWLPFLWMIIWLRLIRIYLSVGAILIGNGPVTPQTIVYFLQTRRRKLRAIRFNGVKEIKRRENEASTSQSSQPGIFDNLRKLVSIAICRPGLQYEPIRRVYISHGYNPEEGERDTQNKGEITYERPRLITGKRQRDLDHDRNSDEEQDSNLTANELLTKYANQNSENDSDYVPDEVIDDEENDANTSSNTSSVSGSSTDDANSSNTTSQEDTPTNNEHQNSEPGKENSEDEINRETIEPSKEKHNDSVEVRNNGATAKEPIHMPTPIPEVKKEPVSDAETNATPQTPKENGQDDNREVDVEPKRVHPARYTLNAPRAVVTARMSTPGHETAAMSKPQVLPALNTISTAGSPVTTLKNPNIAVQPTTQGPDRQQRSNQPHYSNRYRGKNRR